jgi:NCS1 family nucleobase:cation symporter-1
MTPRDPSLYNQDLAPIPKDRRTWGTYNYASLWVAMSVCIPTYMLASGLIAGGMSWWQAIGTILLGNLIVLAPMLLNAHAGAKYGIPFPVFVRASFGDARRQHPGRAARPGGLRMVRHSKLDRRPGHLFHAR